MEIEKLKELGKKVLMRRAEKGFTIEQLAKKSQLSFSTISQLENGKYVPRPRTLYKIALVLEVKPDELLKYFD